MRGNIAIILSAAVAAPRLQAIRLPGNVKSKALARLTAIGLFVVLASPGLLVAQERTAKEHHASAVRYRLIDLGTLGGHNSAEGVQSPLINRYGVVAGVSDTSIPCPNLDCLLFHAFRWREGTMTDLGTLPGGGNSVAFDLDGRGGVVGQAENGLINPIAGVPDNRAVLWEKDGEILDLGTLGGTDSAAFAINDRRQIVGGALNDIPDAFSMPGLGQEAHPFLWQQGEMRDLGTLGGPDGFASLINRRGQIAGLSYVDTNFSINCFLGFPLTTHPFLWEDGKMLDLGTLGGSCAGPAQLNNSGQVVGTSNLAGDLTVHPFLWDGETLKDLGTLGGSFGFGNSLNEAGDVVGAAGTTGDEAAHAFLWRNGVMTDLGTINDDPCSVAHAINARGQVVGATFDCDQTELHGFLWQPGGPMIDLNAFVPPGSDLVVTDGEDINDRGEIAGSGLLPNGDFHAIVFIPCDDDEINGCMDSSSSTNNARSKSQLMGSASGMATHRNVSPAEFVARTRSRQLSTRHLSKRCSSCVWQ